MGSVLSTVAESYLRWALVDGVGPILFSRILEHFHDAERALAAPVAELECVPGIGRKRADSIARARDDAGIALEVNACAEHDVRILCRADDEYPRGLREIPDAPIVLYVRGTLRDTDQVALAIVGSRKCSVYGGEQARRFGELLGGIGFTVVSGMARGIDAFAHHGAVDVGGRSVAVMGRGLTEIYPPENQGLAERLLENGAWVSELPLKTAVRAQNFPARNRIIAGMTLGTLVVEAADRSGALITARLANEYNREVFAVPGRLLEPMAQGTNALIRDSAAKLVTSLEDILVELGDLGKQIAAPGARIRPDEPVQTLAESSAPAIALDACEAQLLQLVGTEEILQEIVLARIDRPAGEALAALTGLELKGLIQRLPGARLRRTAR